MSKDGRWMSANLFVSLAMYAVLLGGLMFLSRDWQPLGPVETQAGQQTKMETVDAILARAHRRAGDCTDTSHSDIWCKD